MFKQIRPSLASENKTEKLHHDLIEKVKTNRRANEREREREREREKS